MPNPAVSGVNIRFELPRSAPVRLSVYDARGRRVAVLAEGTLPAGRHFATWDGRLLSGERVASGVYIVLYQAPGVRQTQRLVMIR
jgi:flagellar hook assembly protein FlgD